MRRTARTTVSFTLATLLVGAAALPVVAQEASGAEAYAFGAQVLGIVPPTPESAADLDDPDATETLIEIPADPLVISGTASTEAQVRPTPELAADLQAIMEGVNADLPDAWNARGYAITEDLTALAGALTADAIAAEAVASCVDGQAVFATASEFENVTLAEEEVPLEELEAILGPIGEALGEQLEPLFGGTTLTILSDTPNDLVLNVPALGLSIVAWETNWDGGTGTTDDSDTVWVNGLRISFADDSPLTPLFEALEPLLGEPVEIVVSHAEATVDCDAPDVTDPGDDPLGDITKAASSGTVAPGDTFTYTIEVPNSDEVCTLTDVAVEDTITGPGTVTATDPEADSVEREGDVTTVTYADIGPIEPGDSVTITIDVEVDDDAADGTVFAEELLVTADCDGEPVEGGLDFDGPTVTDPSAAPTPTPVPDRPVPGQPVATAPAATPGPLPSTGGALGLVALLALAGAYGLRRWSNAS